MLVPAPATLTSPTATTTTTTYTTSPSPSQHKTRINHYFPAVPLATPLASLPPPLASPSPPNLNSTTTTTSTTATSSTTSTTPRILNNYSRNPFYSLTTLNVTSLCCYSNSQDGRARRQRIKKTLTRLTHYDFILLQETKLLTYDTSALRHILHNHKIFYNNNPDNLSGVPPTAGTLVAVKHSVLINYDVTNQIVLPGHCQTLHLSPIKPDWPHISVTNLRLYTGPDKSEVQSTQIHTISKSLDHPTSLRYVAGDLNFTSHTDESTNQLPDEPEAWSTLLAKLSLTEIAQPDHTYFSSSPSSNKFISSKIDKVFISFPEPEWLIATPKTHTTDSILDDIRDFKLSTSSDSTFASSSVNTHVPVCLNFFKQNSNLKSKHKVYHQNVFNDPNFLSHFNATYKPLNSDPVTERANLKTAITTAYTLTQTELLISCS